MKIKVAKVFLIGFLVAFLVVLCSSGNYKDVSYEEFDAVFSEQESVKELKKSDRKMLLKLYALDESDYEVSYLRYSSELMNVDELFIIKVFKEEQLKAVEDSVNRRKSQQLSNFAGYGAEQTELLSKSIILTKGNYVFFGVSKDIEKWKEIFLKEIK
ncbi:MAG: DUF4358 domain-containing protein [Clostridia bacterium]